MYFGNNTSKANCYDYHNDYRYSRREKCAWGFAMRVVEKVNMKDGVMTGKAHSTAPSCFPPPHASKCQSLYCGIYFFLFQNRKYKLLAQFAEVLLYWNVKRESPTGSFSMLKYQYNFFVCVWIKGDSGGIVTCKLFLCRICQSQSDGDLIIIRAL